MDFQTYLRTQQVKHISGAFSNTDVAKKGYLTRGELKLAMVELFGYKPSKYEVNEILSRQRDTCTSCDTIPYEDFQKAMERKFFKQDENDELRQMFVAFDTKCRGFIGFEDAHNIFRVAAPFVKSFDLHRMFREVDRDGDGRISYRDFEFMMKSMTE